MSEPDRAQQPVAETPDRIGKYEVVWLLGKGAMGAVYLAFDPVLERDVALKVMLPQLAADPEHKQRFEREARAVARMMHPNVVTLFDLGYHTDGSPYLVMELLRGRDLQWILDKGQPLLLQAKVSIAIQVLEGLGHAHKVGIVHRDIKPANVFLTDNEVAKIMDFGVARMTATSMTSAGVVLGTAAYMSPEQVAGGRLDGRSDLFSVGCLFAEMLTGSRPFEGESVMSTLYRITHEEPVLDDLPPGPEHDALRAILRRALAKNVEDRFATAADFAKVLRDLGREEAPSPVVPAKPAAPPPPVPTPDGEETVDLRFATPVPPPTVEVPRQRANPVELFRLLREIYVGGKSGQLHFTHGRERRSLSIRKGQIVHGSCDVTGEHLGDVAVRYGLLSQADLTRAIAVVLRDRRRLGSVLPEMGILGRERLEEAVGLHAREILFSVLDRVEGSYAFEERAESNFEDDIACPLSTGELILEATRRFQDPQLVREALGDMDRILARSSDPLFRSQKITLTPTDGFILSRIDGTMSARGVLGLVPLPAEDSERSLFGLLCTGTVDYVDARSRPQSGAAAATGAHRTAASAPPPTAASGVPTPPATAPLTPPAPDPAVKAARAADVEERRQLILEVYADLRQRDHFEVLGLERDATEDDVREAYACFARLLHPDACQDHRLADLREKREAVFIRLGEAYETLRNPTTRARYESGYPPRHFPMTRRAAPPKPVAPSPAPAAAPTPQPAPPPPAPSAPAAPPPPPPKPVAPSRDPVAAAVAEAPPPSDLDREEREEREAVAVAEAVVSAERLIRNEEYWDAIRLLESVMPRTQGRLRARARVALARAYLANPKWRHRAQEVLRQAVKDQPKYAEAYVVLGKIYRAQELLGRAAAMYRKALELRPDHEEALAGLMSLETKAKSPSVTEALKKFFNKKS